MSNLDPRNMPASEEPLDLAILEQMKDRRHYGWKWSGTEECLGSVCTYGPCGLVSLINPECKMHDVTKIAAAKQAHWANDCGGLPASS